MGGVSYQKKSNAVNSRRVIAEKDGDVEKYARARDGPGGRCICMISEGRTLALVLDHTPTYNGNSELGATVSRVSNESDYNNIFMSMVSSIMVSWYHGIMVRPSETSFPPSVPPVA